MTDRRAFLERLGAGAVLAALPMSLDGLGAFAPAPRAEPGSSGAADVDTSWTNRVTGKYRAVFDVADIEQGHGVFRATFWQNQYAEVLKVSPKDCTPVVVLRAKAIALAMQQAFWDEYGVASASAAKHPMTGESTDRNPVLLSSARQEVPAMYDAFALDQFIARGGIALACSLALREMVGLVAKKRGVTEAAAHDVAVAALVPGVILQPSGVFAAIRAQDVGCRYLKAS